MDFPNKSFPYHLYQPSEKRDIFLSYGSHDNIDVDCIEDKQFYPQKIPEGFVNKKTSFRAKRPALPLYSDPESVAFPLVDKVTDPVVDERNEVSQLVFGLKYNRGIVNTKPGKKPRNFGNYKSFHKLKKTLDQLEEGEDITEYDAKILLTKRWKHLLPLHEKYKSTTEIQKVNSKYSDGCLSYLPSKSPDSGGCLISASLDFHKIKLSHIKYDNEEDVKVDVSKSVCSDEEICGLTSCLIGGKGYILTRHATLCKMYSCEDSGGPELLDTIQIEDGEPTSQCLSPYIAGESLIATDEGSVFLWSVDRKEEVIKKKGQRFYCRDQWRQAIFSSHPRQIVLADCTSVELFDLRKRQTDGAGIDIFALPSKFHSPKERIRIIKQHSPFSYVIATDYSMVVTDERFPGHPLLQWQHLLGNPPQYLSVLSNVGSNSLSLISVASQSPMEAFCYMVQGGDHKTLQGVGTPWKLARIDDFTKWDEICNSTDVIAVENKYKRDSLLGLQCVPYEDGFIAFQLDCHLDIYYQVFQLTIENNDKNFAAGPGMNDTVLDDVTVQKGKRWVQAINSSCNQSNFPDYKRSKDCTSFFEEIIQQKPSHIFCSLCHGKEAEERGNNHHASEIMGENSDEDFCHCCQQYLSTGKVISNNASKDLACSISSDELTSLPEVSSLPTDILSQMITRLWRDEDIQDLLPQRDEEVKKKLEKRREERAKSTETISNSDGLPPAIIAMMSTRKQRTKNIEQSLDSDPALLDVDDEDQNSSIVSGETEDKSSHYGQLEGESCLSDIGQLKSQAELSGRKNNLDGSSASQGYTVGNEIESDSGNKASVSITEEDIKKDLKSKRQRHSSLSSLSSIRTNLSVGSTRSNSLPGFMRTPTRIYKSPLSNHAEKGSDVSSSDLMDEQFLSQESIKSLQLFTNVQSNITDSPAKRFKLDSPVRSQKQIFRTPSLSPLRKPKVKKKFVSGF